MTRPILFTHEFLNVEIHIQDDSSQIQITKSEIEYMFKKILVAIDSSESSRTIFDRALILAKADRFSRGEATPTELMLLHVLTLLDNFDPLEAQLAISAPTLRAYAQKLENLERAETQKRRSLADEAIAAGISTEFTQQIGDPGMPI